MDCGVLLFLMGILPGSRGFLQTFSAVLLASRDPDALQLVTKRLYPDVARKHGISWRAVERNIRITAEKAWATNPKLLQQLAGCKLTQKPTASQFIAILVDNCSFD